MFTFLNSAAFLLVLFPVLNYVSLLYFSLGFLVSSSSLLFFCSSLFYSSVVSVALLCPFLLSFSFTLSVFGYQVELLMRDFCFCLIGALDFPPGCLRCSPHVRVFWAFIFNHLKVFFLSS